MDVGLSISDTADILGFFDSLESLVQHSNKQKKKHYVRDSYCVRNVLMKRGGRRTAMKSEKIGHLT